jgi:hypothetical protein
MADDDRLLSLLKAHRESRLRLTLNDTSRSQLVVHIEVLVERLDGVGSSIMQWAADRAKAIGTESDDKLSAGYLNCLEDLCDFIDTLAGK